MIIREASIDDWYKSQAFFKKIYRNNHPLHNKEFWIWQYGNPEYGKSFICLNHNDEIVGHIGIGFEGGIAWMLNAFIDEKYRGKGIMSKLFEIAGKHGNLAATGASELGLTMFKNRNWIRYYDLIRYVKVNPILKELSVENVCKSISISIDDLIIKDSHYFQQPGIKGLLLDDGSRAVSQQDVGGLRIVDFKKIEDLENQAWSLGYLWIDYVTSWNNLKIKDLEKNNWELDYKSVVPWLLNPIKKNVFCKIAFLSEFALDRRLVVNMSYSDHGRVGSIK